MTGIDEPDHAALIQLYQQTHSEITRYRDLEWKIVGWSLALMVGALAVARLSAWGGQLDLMRAVLLGVFELTIGVYSAWHIYFVHKELTFNRKMRVKLERGFRLYSKWEPLGEGVLPAAWQHKEISFWSGKGHLWTWWGLIGVTCIYVLLDLFLGTPSG